MTTLQYIDSINKRYQLGNATEHTFRGDLGTLIENLLPAITVTNEPKRFKFGAPDYILTEKEIPVGYIEAKDIDDQDLYGKKKSGHKEQFDRYKKSLDNLIFTDYLHFLFYREGELMTEIRIGKVEGGKIVPISENFEEFENLVTDFTTHVIQSIRSPKRLAEMMAGKARLLFDVLHKSLIGDEKNDDERETATDRQAFKQILIHDIEPDEFADIYAQTIAYGMFAARLHDYTLDDFSRQEAAELIPKSNPFLRRLFGYIAGPDIDDRIKWIVDDLAKIFLHTDVEQVLRNYGKATQTEDPIIHFYETFLTEYDPALRKARGVWYTPNAVVNFIVRAVDDILKEEFDLPQGLADTSKTNIKVNTDIRDKRSATGYKQQKKEVHKVQILDPATGTGTFLAEVIKHIYKKFKGQEGIWGNYVKNQLLPRLNGFELLMASYAMAHLKLDLLLKETGYTHEDSQRFRVFLTNSLEEHDKDTGTLFANWLSQEANEANRVKRDTPVMVIMGNPPYSVSSVNKGQWIQNLIADYKKNLNERKINLDDDYIKFIRYGQHYIDKNGSGVLAYISNNSFIDGITHRQMRKTLLESFNEIYILNLHGYTKPNEKTTIDGKRDENVFDIQQGVSINIFVKKSVRKKDRLAQVFYYSLYGKRKEKYKALFSFDYKKTQWEKVKYRDPNYFFTPVDYKDSDIYENGIKMDELFIEHTSGIETQKNDVTIQFSKEDLMNVLDDFQSMPKDKIKEKYKIKEGRDWKIDFAKKDVIINGSKNIHQIHFKPFDFRYTYLSGKTKGFIAYPRFKVMRNMIENNIGFLAPRQVNREFHHVFVSRIPTDGNLTATAKKFGSAPIFPLYLYLKSDDQTEIDSDEQPKRKPNLNNEIVQRIARGLGLSFVEEESEKNGEQQQFAPIDLLDYIYAILHSPTYRETYKEFLKIDFPRVPYPTDQNKFWQLVELGGQLRKIHLLEDPVVEDYITTYPKPGNNEITRRLTKTKPGFIPEKDNPEMGKIWINEEQYFDQVPKAAWKFYIGGYQPAQKWLKDRRDRVLEFDDILHYQKIIVALTETDSLMKEIDGIEII